MRHLFFLFLSVLLLSSCDTPPNPGKNATKATNDSPATGKKPVRKEKTYWLAFLKKGPNVNQDSAALNKIQQAHLKHMRDLTRLGKVVMAGPIEGDPMLRGVYILDCRDSLEVLRLMNADTALISGRVRIEFHPWLVEQGIYRFK